MPKVAEQGFAGVGPNPAGALVDGLGIVAFAVRDDILCGTQ
jgi:hypothetical protein